MKLSLKVRTVISSYSSLHFAAFSTTIPVFCGFPKVEGLSSIVTVSYTHLDVYKRQQQIGFKAGQYINIILDDGERRAFSFANPPHEPEFVELQIRLVEGGRFTTHVFEKMKEDDEIRFEGPLGDFALRESERPIVFVAGATGFAPVKSMVEDAFKRGLTRPIFLYWGVKQLRDQMCIRDRCNMASIFPTGSF